MMDLLQEIKLNSTSRENLYLYLKNKYQLSSHLNHKLIILDTSFKQVLKIGWSIWNIDEIKEEQCVYSLAFQNNLSELFEPLKKISTIIYQKQKFGIYSQKKLIINNITAKQLMEALIIEYGELKIYNLYNFCSTNKIMDLVPNNFGFDVIENRYKIIDYPFSGLPNSKENVYIEMEKYFNMRKGGNNYKK